MTTDDAVTGALKKLTPGHATMLRIPYGQVFYLPSGTDTVEVRIAGDTGPRISLGTVFGNPAFAFGDGAGANWGLLTVTSGLLTLTSANLQVPALGVTGLTGATSAIHPSRYCGCTTSGAAPTDGTFAVGDWVIGVYTFGGLATIWVCISAGTPGTWVQVSNAGSGGSVATDSIFDAKGDLAVGTGADTAARLAAGSNGQALLADSTQTTGLHWVSLAVTDVSGAAPLASPTFTGTVAATGGAVNLTDGTAAHGKVQVAVNALGSTVKVFGDSSDSQPKSQLSPTGLLIGPGGVAAIDFTILRTGSAAAAVTGVLSMTSPAITTPTGIVKGDVGLGNVDNTSNATERAAVATLTNKTLTSPVVNTPTGIVKGDVGLGSVDNTADTAKPVSTAQQTALDLKANIAAPIFTGTVSGTGGAVSITDGTAAHGKATTAVNALGSAYNVFGDTGDTQPKAQLAGGTSPGLLIGPGGTTAVDFMIRRTGSAAAAVTGVLTMTSPAITTPTGIVKGDVGLGNVDNTSNATERAATATLTNHAVAPRESTITSNATWAPNADTTDIFTVTAQAAAATTISNPSGTPVQGQKLTVRVKDNGTARALTWSGTQWRASSDLPLPTTTVLSKTMYLGFVYNSTDTKWDLLAVLGNI